MRDEARTKKELIQELNLLRKRLDQLKRSGKEHRREEKIRRVLAELGRKLSAVSNSREAAMVILEVADDLFGWDACYLVIYSPEENTLHSVITMDTIDGERREVSSSLPDPNASRLVMNTMNKGAFLIRRNMESAHHTYRAVPFGDKSRRSASLMFVPIRKGRRNVGTLSIQSYSPGAYDDDDLALLQVLADHCSGALDRTYAEQKLRQKEMLTEKLSQLGKNLAAATTPKQAATLILDTADQLFGWDATYVSLYSARDDTIRSLINIDTLKGKRREFKAPYEGPAEGLISKQAMEKGARLILRGEPSPGEKTKLIRFGDTSRSSESLMFVPIRKGEKNIGVLSIQSYTPKAYTSRHLETLQFLADHCGGALERILTEDKLRDSEGKLHLLLEQIPSLLWTTDVSLRFTVLLGAGFRPLQMNIESLVGKSLFEFFQTKKASFPPIKMHKRALKGKAGTFEMKIGDKIFHSYVEPLRNIDSVVIGCICVSHDITERKQAEEELKTAHRIYREAIENARGVPYSKNYAEDKYGFLGQGCEDLLGVPASLMTGKKMRGMVREIVPRDAGPFTDPRQYGRAFREGKIKNYCTDLQVITANGDVKWLSDNAIPILDDKTGKVIGSMGILQDITARKQAEKLYESFASLGQKLNSVTTRKEAARVILDTAEQIFDWDAAYVGVYHEEADELESVIHVDRIDGEHREVDPPVYVRSPTPMARQTLEKGPRLLSRGNLKDPQSRNLVSFGDYNRKSASLMYVPIRKGDKNIGILSIQSYTAGLYTDTSLKWLQFLADHASGAMDRVMAEERLLSSEEQLRLLTRQIPAILWTTDEDLRLTLLLGSGLDALNLRPNQFVGKSLSDFFGIQDPRFPPISLHRKALEGKSSAFELPLLGKTFHSYVEPLRDASGKIIGCIDVAHDITERKEALEELKKFSMAIEQTATSVIISDMNQTIEYVNREFERLTGYTREEIVGKTPHILISDKQDEKFYTNLLETILSGKVYRGVIINQRKDGELYYEEKTVTPLKDMDGNITNFVETGKDITDRIRAEEALRQAHDELERRVEARTRDLSRSNVLLKREIEDRIRAEEKLAGSLSLLRATLESATDGILVVNSRGEIVNFNKKFLKMWHIHKSIVKHRDYERARESIYAQLIHPEKFRSRLKILSKRPDTNSFDVLELKDGRIFECYSQPQKVKENSVGRVWSFRDVTKRRKTEKQIERSEAIYREAIETAAGVPYRLIYAENRYDFVGDGIRTLLGISPDEFRVDFLRNIIRETWIVDPDAPTDHVECVKAFKKGRLDQYRADLKVVTPQGQEKWISDCSVPVRDEKTGKVIGSLGILQDISKRKRMEEESRRQQEQLVQAEKLVALGILVSGMAHEINNPNNFIMMNIPLLKEAWENVLPVLDDYYENHGDFLVGGVYYSHMRKHILELCSCISAGAERIRNIVQELRDFARESPADLTDVINVNSVVKSSLTLLENMINQSTNRFSVHYQDNLPEIRGNFQRLEQVVINLIQNACQALTDKNQRIMVVTEFDNNDGTIVVKIKDEGRGIPGEIRKHIMDPFFTTKREKGGVGLGLSISSKIITEHRGTLKFSTKPGKGTTAILELPLSDGEDLSREEEQ